MSERSDRAKHFAEQELTVSKLFEWSKALAAFVAALGVLTSGYVMAGFPYPATTSHVDQALEPVLEAQREARQSLDELREFAMQTRGLILRADRRQVLRELELYRRELAAGDDPSRPEIRRLLEKLGEDISRIDQQIEALDGP